MKPTILDIAKESGVSKSTVSLVLNNSDLVKFETKYKVEQAIKKLGYVPNHAARELITKKTYTLGLVFLTSNHSHKAYAFDSVVETLLYDTSNGISAGLKENTPYSLLIERFSMAKDTNDTNMLPDLIKKRRVDGLFLIGGLFNNEFIDHIKEHNIPVVVIGRHIDDIDSISVNVPMVGYIGTKYLIEKGHKSIAFINGARTSENSEKKLEGVMKAVEETNLGTENIHVRYSTGYSGLEGYQAFKSLWESGIRPDAVFGGSDGITTGILRYLYEKRIYIPKEISVLGYEDSILAEYSSPPLTVIDTKREKMGKEACNILLNRIKKKNAKTVTLNIKPSLIIRDSVADRTGS